MVQGWLKGCWETNCEEMKRLRSIVAARLEPKSRREMEDAAMIAYTASLVSTERSHIPCVDRATLTKFAVQRKIPKGAVAQQYRFSQCILVSTYRDECTCFNRLVSTSASPPYGNLPYRASASTNWFPQILGHGIHWATAVSSSPPPKSALD